MFRVTPKLPVQSMKSYQILSPRDTHYRTVSCAEADCGAQAKGWETFIDETTSLGQRQAYYIRHDTRRYTETRNEYGITVFTFPPGQTCFASHDVPLDRPEFFLVRGGDWRGNPRGESFKHTTAESWTDDFATHQQTLSKAQG